MKSSRSPGGSTTGRRSGASGTLDRRHRVNQWDSDATVESLVKRFPLVDQTLGEMKAGLFSTRAEPRRSMPVRRFEGGQIKGIIIFHFWAAVYSRAEGSSILPLPKLRRTEARLTRILSEDWLPPHRVELARILHDLQVLKGLQEARRQRGTCPVISNVITDLATWFLWCQPLASYRSADLYRFIGRIVEQIGDPQCLACGNRHSFRDWRRVRARDFFRDVPPKQRELKIYQSFGRGLMLGAPIRGSVDSARHRENVDEFLSAFEVILSKSPVSRRK